MNSDSQSNSQAHRKPGLRATLTVCAILLLAGAAALGLIFNTEPGVERETAVRETAMLVEVTTPETGTFLPQIEAMGTVMAARDITLRPRVDGEVAGIAPAFVPGGFVKEGEVLLRIDDSDYQTALRQRRSELEQAIADLEIEQGRQDLAVLDYQRLNKPLPEDKKSLVLREPHLRASEARIESARAAVKQAETDLERTVVKAPFDAQVLSRDVNLGSQVHTGDPLARLAGLETYWVEATVPLDKLRWLSFSDGGTKAGSPVSIRHRTAWPAGEVRQGYLYRLIGSLEGETRLARVLVAVEDPLALTPESSGLPPLMIGAFLECRIQGKEISHALRLPRDVIRSNDALWLMRGAELAIQPVEIVFQDSEYAYITGGLNADDQVITSSLATVEEGVPLRLDSTVQP